MTSSAVSSRPMAWWMGAAIAPRRQHARYMAIAGAVLGACHVTTTPGSTP